MTAFVFNTYLLLMYAILVMWMAAGFTMLEAGSVSSRNASVICLKNLCLYAVAGLAYYLLGYNLMYVDVGQWAGSFQVPYTPTAAEAAVLEGGKAPEAMGDSATGADWFFQMVFVATTASILSGAIAERVKLWVFLLFVTGLCALVYPLVGAWAWGGGWLAKLGFHDFAGATVVHSTGGWAALAGAVVLGPREGRFPAHGPPKPIPASNVPLATLGVFILWMGWFGFNAGSQLRFAEPADAVRTSAILINTNLSAASGLVCAFALARVTGRRLDLLVVLNGAIAGLVAITAAADFADHRLALLIGAVGGAISTVGIWMLRALRIDDVVGAIPAHLGAGIWGTLATPLTTDASLLVQAIGAACVGLFVFLVAITTWLALEWSVGARVSAQVEAAGQDASELGIAAYPDFAAPAPDRPGA